jgi:DNA-binding NarL/FixJ family response regulator
MTPIRILIADDHEMVRRGVRSVLEQQPDWVVCAEATTGRETVAAAVRERPDVIVLDISMPELNGLEAARQIRHVWPANIIVLTMHDSDELVAEVLDAGARGYVLKSDAGRLLVDAVTAVLEQRAFMTERVSAIADQTTRRRKGSVGTPQTRLTPREREVLQLLTEARSNKEIGTLLGMSTRTAETHRAHIMAKLNLHSVSELVRYAIRNRIIEA